MEENAKPHYWRYGFALLLSLINLGSAYFISHSDLRGYLTSGQARQDIIEIIREAKR